MRKRRYEILLPIRFNDGRPVSGELLEQTREELMARFSAVQMQPHTVLGLWVYEGSRYASHWTCRLQIRSPTFIGRSEVRRQGGGLLG